MTSKHTPGPWYVGREDENTGEIEVNSDGRPYVCLVFPGAIDEVTPANARLIAAAPELLEALEGFVSCWDDCNSPLAFVSRARAAIAKVTGASPAPKVAPREEHPPCPVCFDTECNGECMENL